MVVGLVVRQEGAFFLTPNLTPERRQPGLVARTPLNTPARPAPVPRLASDPSVAAAPGHGNAPRLSNYSKAAGHRVKYRS